MVANRHWMQQETAFVRRFCDWPVTALHEAHAQHVAGNMPGFYHRTKAAIRDKRDTLRRQIEAEWADYKARQENMRAAECDAVCHVVTPNVTPATDKKPDVGWPVWGLIIAAGIVAGLVWGLV